MSDHIHSWHLAREFLNHNDNKRVAQFVCDCGASKSVDVVDEKLE